MISLDGKVHDAERLKELQALPLERKIQITQTRIIEWYQHYNGNVCVSFSGGKDSTVLLHIARQIYPDIHAVFSNTGLEYPEIQKFVRGFENIDIVVPEMKFKQVLTEYGYPLISKEVAETIHYARRTSGSGATGKQIKYRNELLGKRVFNGGSSMYNKERWYPLAEKLPARIHAYCCAKMKKAPIKKYQKRQRFKPMLATMASESLRRKQAWIRNGCNAFDSTDQKSTPMAFWTEQDVLAYIVKYGIEIASVYGDIVSVDRDGLTYPPMDLIGETRPNLKCTGCERTGCIFCGFGFHNEKGETRFQRLARTHPRQYEYCMGGGQWADNPDYDPTAPEMDGEWKNWNPKKIWIPSDTGLGMKVLFDMVNEIYGKDFYRYE